MFFRGQVSSIYLHTSHFIVVILKFHEVLCSVRRVKERGKNGGQNQIKQM